jgi:hypothetical protein
MPGIAQSAQRQTATAGHDELAGVADVTRHHNESLDFVAHADAGDVRRGGRADAGASALRTNLIRSIRPKEVLGGKIEVHIFAAQDPVVGERVFHARSDRDAPMVAAFAGQEAGRAGIVAIRALQIRQ